MALPEVEQGGDERGRARMEDKLREAALAVSAAEGEAVFPDLLKALASILGVDFALIAVYCDPERTQLRTLATLFDGRIARNVSYPIAGTPCESAMGRDFGFFPEGVRSRFPKDGVLHEYAIEGYAASTLNDAGGKPVGLVTVMSRRRLENAALTEAMLKIFAARISAEIERQRAREADRAAEAALRASEDQYRSIFNATTDSLVLRDAAFRIVDVNPAYEALGGWRRDEVVGRAELTLQLPELSEDRREQHRRALAGETIHMESPAARKDGTRFLLEIYGVPMQYGGKPHVLYIGRDITARKAAEQALRSSEEQYRAIFDGTADSLVLRDEEFRIVDVNPGYEAMSGRPRAEALGRRDVTMSNPELTRRIRELHARALGGELVQWESAAARKSGEAFDIEVRGIPIRYRGRPHVLYIGRDITARNRAEAERVALEAQLRQAQKMEAIGHLTGGIAHDFNNILQSILGNLVLAAERQGELGDARLGKYLDRAQHSAQRARELIAQLLTFSRGQRGERKPVSLAELARDAGKLLRSTLPATLDLRTSLEDAVPLLELDPVQVEQVILNLCINARDAMSGAGTIRLGVRTRDSLVGVCASCHQKIEGCFVELYVRDSGPGISPQVRDRMFEPFFSTKAVGKGSGMGLSLVHGIVHEHGGHVLVDSEPNDRTKFRVLFAVPEARRSAPGAADALASAAPRVRARLSGRVLVVDDEEAIREFMTDLLEGWGLQVVALPDGAAAHAAVQADPARFDLVISDQTMPQLTGLALAREIQRLRPGLTVILYTGYGDDLSPEELRAAGVARLVRKPIDPAQFFPLLAAHLAPY